MGVKKKIKKTYKKVRRFFKRYIRLLVRHTKAKDYSVLIYTILAVIAIILMFSLIGMCISSIVGMFGKTKEPSKNTTEIVTTTEDEYALQKNEAKRIYDANSQYLILVNKSNPLDESYSFTHHTLNCGLDIDVRIHTDLVNMLNDLNSVDLHYSIVSAYRSREQQQEIINQNIERNMSLGMTYDDAVAETYKTVQGVGTSEHETGMCLDITSEGVFTLTEDVEEYPTNIWLAEHCYEYGFILRYPKDKEDITGISYEPWHFRYVGYEAAKFITENNLCLEEFYELAGVDTSGSTTITDTTIDDGTNIQ